MLPWFNGLVGVFQSPQAQAYLFEAVTDSGLTQAGDGYAQARLCKQQSYPACGNCHSCQLFSTNAHPDFFYVTPEEGKKSIGINHIRELCNKLNQTPQVSASQVALIDLADMMTLEAANALLKTLEEPPASSQLILLANDLHKIPVTIKSRCQKWRFVGEPQQLEDWLCQQSGCDALTAETALRQSIYRPLLALKIIQQVPEVAYIAEYRETLLTVAKGSIDPITAAAELENKQLLTYLDSIYGLVVDSLTISHSQDALLRLLQQVSERQRHKFVDFIITLKKDALSKANLSPQLILENVMLHWQQLTLNKI